MLPHVTNRKLVGHCQTVDGQDRELSNQQQWHIRKHGKTEREGVRYSCIRWLVCLMSPIRLYNNAMQSELLLLDKIGTQNHRTQRQTTITIDRYIILLQSAVHIITASRLGSVNNIRRSTKTICITNVASNQQLDKNCMKHSVNHQADFSTNFNSVQPS